MTLRILVDADACPVKDEIYKVAYRREVAVTVVSNSPIRTPAHPLIARVVVGDAFDAADDWIVEAADARCVVVTTDILLADRCLKVGAAVIAPTGSLAALPLAARLAGLAAGVAVHAAAGGRMLPALGAGLAVLLLVRAAL